MTKYQRYLEHETELLVFGQNVRRARKKKNWKLNELACKAGYDRMCLSRLEDGEQNIKLGTALKIAEALDVSFPKMFSRNFMEEKKGKKAVSENFQENDYLSVFVENFKRQLKKTGRRQMTVYIETGIDETAVSRIVKGKNKNPTIRTLSAMGHITESGLDSLFTRI